MKRALIYFTKFDSALGGGEYLPLLMARELQKSHAVTLALDWASDVPRAARTLGVDLDTDRLAVVVLKPKARLLRRIDAAFPVFSTRRLQRLARRADICLSAANPADFGKSAHHFVYLLRTIGDTAFRDFLAHAPAKTSLARLRRRARAFLADKILRPLLGVRSTRQILADPRERIYPPSRYVETVMTDFYGPFRSEVFYPPTVFAPEGVAATRDPLKVVYIGQIFPEKKVAEIIAIVERARAATGLGLTLALAGPIRETPYAAHIRALVAARPWATLVGGVYGSDKAAFLASGTYALHAERDEAFGISVTEYLKAGAVAIVPDEGGTAEIVDTPDLAYRTDDDAVRILVRLLTDDGFRAAQQRHCAARARRFAFDAYAASQTRLLERIVRP